MKTTLDFDQAVWTDFPSSFTERNALSPEEKVVLIKEHFQSILEILGLDLEDPSMKKTPERLAKMYVHEIFSGMNPENFPEMLLIEEEFLETTSQPIVHSASFISFCEHHFLPIVGKAYISYIPHKTILGLSKINRLVRFFAKRPQLQERLTVQIANSLQSVLETKDVAVCIEATHFCVLARGVEDQDSLTNTKSLHGSFLESPFREDFFREIQQLKNR